MENLKTARIFVAANAAFSCFMGLEFLFAAGRGANILFSEQAEWQVFAMRLLGAGLIIFGFGLIVVAMNRFATRRRVLLITIMDLAWVLASIFLLLTFGNHFSEVGTVAIAVVALFVTFFAFGQFVGARKIRPPISQASVQSAGSGV